MAKQTFKKRQVSGLKDRSSAIKLTDGSRIGIIGSGPAGSFFNYFILDMAERIGMRIHVDIYDGKDFTRCGPVGCNHCGGIVSESLVQILASEGINIPTRVAQRGIDSYVLHMDVGNVKIETPIHEKRIVAMYRGSGPLGTKEIKWDSFDRFLQELAVQKGAHFIHDRVTSINFEKDGPLVITEGGLSNNYDLIVGAVGVKSNTTKLFEKLEFGYQPPSVTKTFICEFPLGQQMVQKHFGSSMHVFLLDIPRLEFAALIPKGDNVTMVLLGRDIDKTFVRSFLNAPEVKRCFPSEVELSEKFACQCYPMINIKSAVKPFADRMVLIGDCATTKLYKNGIGAAYSTAKAAAVTAILHGVSSADFERYYWPICRNISNDNALGKMIFAFTRVIQKTRFARRGILRMVIKEQLKKGKARRQSSILWDTFTGSATYFSIFLRSLSPFFFMRLLYEMAFGILSFNRNERVEEDTSEINPLGKLYRDGETIITEGETGDCMYVIQSGKVLVVQLRKDKEIKLAELSERDFFGEMALFENSVRSSTVRAQGEVKVLTVDKKTLLRTIHENPSLAFRIVEKMSSRIRDMDNQISRMKASDRRNWDTRPEYLNERDSNRISSLSIN